MEPLPTQEELNPFLRNQTIAREQQAMDERSPAFKTSPSDFSLLAPTESERMEELVDNFETTCTQLIKALHLADFVERFQQLSWDVASTHREQDATPDQQVNAKELIGIFVSWMTVDLGSKIGGAALKGNLIGALLYGLARDKRIDLRDLVEWLDLIEDDTYNLGEGWADLFKDETSRAEADFNKALDQRLGMMRGLERAFLVSLTCTLVGFED